MGQNRIIVAKAALDDAQPIAELASTTFLATFEKLFANYEADLAAYLARTFSAEKLAESIAKPGNCYWIARDEAGPVGYAKLKLGSGHPLLPFDGAAQLQKIYVHDRAIGGGVGLSLVEKVLEEASSRGAEDLWLSVHQSNDRARRFYERLGWRDFGSDQFAIGQLVLDYRIMARKLRLRK